MKKNLSEVVIIIRPRTTSIENRRKRYQIFLDLGFEGFVEPLTSLGSVPSVINPGWFGVIRGLSRQKNLRTMISMGIF